MSWIVSVAVVCFVEALSVYSPASSEVTPRICSNARPGLSLHKHNRLVSYALYIHIYMTQIHVLHRTSVILTIDLCPLAQTYQ